MRKKHTFNIIDINDLPIGEHMTREQREKLFVKHLLEDPKPLMDMIRRMSKLEGRTLANGIEHIISFSCPPELKDKARDILINYARMTGDYTKVDNLKPTQTLKPFLTPIEEVQGG